MFHAGVYLFKGENIFALTFGATMPTQPSTYTDIYNPVLSGMCPDPSWMWDEEENRIVLVNSTFELVPGLPIHVSDDLSSWHHIADAVDTDMAERLLLRFVQDSGGIYAPTIRKIHGSYVIAATVARLNDQAALEAGVSQETLQTFANAGGNFILTADTLQGPWRGPFWVEGALGIDPDIFEDCDGVVYWTQTCPALEPQWEGQTEVWTHRIDPTTWQLVPDEFGNIERIVLWHGYGIEAVWAEGPHLYRVGDYVYLLTAEGGTSFEHSQMAMRVYAPQGLNAAMKQYAFAVRTVYSDGKVNRYSTYMLDQTHRLLHANKKNPILTHRHLGLQYPVQCVGHGDILCHPRLGWWMVCLGMRETRDKATGELLSYCGRETFIAPLSWEHNFSPEPNDDIGWPVVAQSLGRLPEHIRIYNESNQSSALDYRCSAVVVEDNRQVHVYMDDGSSDKHDSSTQVTQHSTRFVHINPSDSSLDKLYVRGSLDAKYVRVTKDTCIITMPECNNMFIRQDSNNYVRLEQRMVDGDTVLQLMCTLCIAGKQQTQSFELSDPCFNQVALVLADNRLTVLACAQDSNYLNIAQDICICGKADSPHIHNQYQIFATYDARFLSTERAGGFVGCLVGYSNDITQ